MKKIVLVMALMLSALVASASETLYFTYNQSIRAVTLLNNEDELMIYCGYEDELPTYCLVNEVWAEQISSSFYEIWIHGYDAYTGEEIYMPIDMECIWLLRSGHIISAAQTLRFRNSHARPAFAWQMPPYNPWVRGPRPVAYYYSYHYDIHRPGWHWRHHPNVHYHPYYCRHISHPAPLPHAPFTPGKNIPGYKVTQNGSNGEIGYEYLGTPNTSADRITASRSATVVKNDPSSRSGNRITSSRSSKTVTTTDRISGRSTSAVAPVISESRGSSTGASQSTGRSTSTATPGSSSRGTSTSQSTGRSTSTATPGSSSRGTSASQSTGRSSSSATPGSSSRGTSTSQSTGRSSSSATPSRSTSASQSTDRSSSSTTPSRSTGTSQSTSRSSSSATPSRSTGTSQSTSRGTSTSNGTTTSRKTDNTSSSRGTAARTR